MSVPFLNICILWRCVIVILSNFYLPYLCYILSCCYTSINIYELFVIYYRAMEIGFTTRFTSPQHHMNTTHSQSHSERSVNNANLSNIQTYLQIRYVQVRYLQVSYLQYHCCELLGNQYSINAVFLLTPVIQ